ncbi:MAG: tRNA epoxyqueuosine(34) reductase QueG [Myxococcota bacterium]
MLSSQRVAALAKESAFDLCGFARAEPIPPAALLEWLEAGMDADMDWMGARAADRLDVGRLLPNARTVVALACNYYQGELASPIARYARGRDYHATLRDRLRAFRRRLHAAYPEVETYGSVDSGPLMEKVWAARAGIGYVGKNGCLITEAFGSYVVLAALVLDAPVDSYADGSLPDRCGSCSLCLSSCPTEALAGEGRVDSRRCLSYQTIENDGAVPLTLREALADVVFGCDICQEVCPLNARPVIGGERFAPRAVASLSVRELAALTRAQYDALVPGTALARAKYDGLRRNAAYALGAARERDAKHVLESLLGDASEPVREAAAWALTRLA